MIEKIETLNQRLIDIFGCYSDGRATYRIVFSDEQFEKRWSSYTDSGMELLNPEVRELPKYRQWISPPCYVLERLLEIPEGMQTDQVERTSYEPLWVFRDKDNNPLIPVWPAIKLILSTVLENAARAVGKKYKDPREQLTDPKIAAEVRSEQLDKLETEIFGEREQDPLAYGQGIVVPGNYKKETVN